MSEGMWTQALRAVVRDKAVDAYAQELSGRPSTLDLARVFAERLHEQGDVLAMGWGVAEMAEYLHGHCKSA